MAHKYAPFTPEEVETLRKYQETTMFHPFTCCSHDGCDRLNQPNEGALIPTEEGWICPCGKWKQNWCHEFMTDASIVFDPFLKFREKSSPSVEDYDEAMGNE